MVYHDPGVPPLIDDNAETNQRSSFLDGFNMGFSYDP